jgi:hypothetical protein
MLFILIAKPFQNGSKIYYVVELIALSPHEGRSGKLEVAPRMPREVGPSMPPPKRALVDNEWNQLDVGPY